MFVFYGGGGYVGYLVGEHLVHTCPMGEYLIKYNELNFQILRAF